MQVLPTDVIFEWTNKNASCLKFLTSIDTIHSNQNHTYHWSQFFYQTQNFGYIDVENVLDLQMFR